MKTFKQITEELNEGKKALAIVLAGSLSVPAHAMNYSNKDRMSSNVEDIRGKPLTAKHITNTKYLRNRYNHLMMDHIKKSGITSKQALKTAGDILKHNKKVFNAHDKILNQIKDEMKDGK